MKPADRELMEQIFGEEVEAPEVVELDPEEARKMMVAVTMINTFGEMLNEMAEKAFLNGEHFFLAPPTNFSFSVN